MCLDSQKLTASMCVISSSHSFSEEKILKISTLFHTTAHEIENKILLLL